MYKSCEFHTHLNIVRMTEFAMSLLKSNDLLVAEMTMMMMITLENNLCEQKNTYEIKTCRFVQEMLRISSISTSVVLVAIVAIAYIVAVADVVGGVVSLLCCKKTILSLTTHEQILCDTNTKYPESLFPLISRCYGCFRFRLHASKRACVSLLTQALNRPKIILSTWLSIRQDNYQPTTVTQQV